MDGRAENNYTVTPEIRLVTEQLMRLLQPRTIYLYNQRVGASGETTGFKLCVIAPVADKQEAEKQAYLEIDCDVPFDLLLYTPEEWAEITERPDSFASKICRTGLVIHG